MGSKRWIVTLLVKVAILFLCSPYLQAQQLIGRVVSGGDGEPLYGATLFLEGQQNNFALTDSLGRFTIAYKGNVPTDTLTVSYVGFQAKKISLEELINTAQISISLLPAEALKGITVLAKRGMAEQFAVSTLNQLDILVSPDAQGDPLKALTMLPSSTTTDESAAISLRGSPASQTRVFVNDVPVYRPTLSNQLNQVGSFSIFNVSAVDRLEVFASNPPIYLPNATSGAISIYTKKEAPPVTNLTFSVANLAGYTARKDKLGPNSKIHHQYFASVSSAGLLKYLSADRLGEVQSFSFADAGMNAHWKGKGRGQANLFIHYLKNNSEFTVNQGNFRDNFDGGGQRAYAIFNLGYPVGSSATLTLNTGLSLSEEAYKFGVLDYGTDERNTYASLDYRAYPNRSLTLQIGGSWESLLSTTQGIFPRFSFLLDDENFAVAGNFKDGLNRADLHAFATYSLGPSGLLSGGLKIDLGLASQPLLSPQISYKQSLDHGDLILATGQYQGFTVPNTLDFSYRTLTSRQVSMDYRSTLGHSFGAFYKHEQPGGGSSYQLVGLEGTVSQLIGQSIRLSASATGIQVLDDESTRVRALGIPTYFLRGQAQYLTKKGFSAGLSFMARDGLYYTPIVGSELNQETGSLQPLLAETSFSRQLNAYRTLNSNFAQQFRRPGKYIIVIFVGVANVLDRHNQRAVIYDGNYLAQGFSTYSRFTFFLGGNLSFR